MRKTWSHQLLLSDVSIARATYQAPEMIGVSLVVFIQPDHGGPLLSLRWVLLLRPDELSIVAVVADDNGLFVPSL